MYPAMMLVATRVRQLPTCYGRAMERWIELARAETPRGDTMVLRRRGGEFEIRFNGWELISTRTSVSEEALPRLAFAELDRPPRRILIGGLGMGYMLRAALDGADPNVHIVVSEIVPAVVDWVRGPLANLAGVSLDDRRVQLCVGDVADQLAGAAHDFDVILLDTDNGPDAVMYQPNRILYERRGLESVRRALVSDGVAGVWSADRSVRFERELDAVALRWRRVAVDASGGRGIAEHSIYLAGHR
jgi:spermidine synthase